MTQEVRACWPKFDPQNLYGKRREPPDLLSSASRTHMKSQRCWHLTVIPALLPWDLERGGIDRLDHLPWRMRWSGRSNRRPRSSVEVRTGSWKGGVLRLPHWCPCSWHTQSKLVLKTSESLMSHIVWTTEEVLLVCLLVAWKGNIVLEENHIFVVVNTLFLGFLP